MKILFLGSCLIAQSLAAVPASRAEAPRSEPVRLAPAFRPLPGIYVAAGRLSASIENVPLSHALELISDRIEARIVLYGSSDENLSAQFVDQPLEEGLRRLFRGKNLVFYYLSDSRMPAAVKLVEVRIFIDASEGGQATIFDPGKSPSEPTTAKSAVSTPTANDERRTALIRRLLEAKEPRERKEAAAALGKLNDLAVIEPLSQALSSDADASVRVAAADALAKTWDESVIGALSQSITTDGSSAVREAAARALGLTWSENAVPVLLATLANDRDALVREQAAVSLGQTADEGAVPGLVHALAQDPRLFVRNAAAEALGAIGGREALDALAQAITHDVDPWVKQTAAEAALNSSR